MPLATTGELITDAAAEHRAVAAFNVITLEHVEAVIAGAEAVHAPVVLQVSENAVRFRHGRLLPIARAAGAAAERAAVPVALHLDHVHDDDLLRQAPGAGFSSVMYDAARLPRRTSPPHAPPPTGPMPKGFGSRRSWVRSAARTASRRPTRTHPAPGPTPVRRPPSWPTPGSTRLPSPSAAAMR